MCLSIKIEDWGVKETDFKVRLHTINGIDGELIMYKDCT